MATLSSGLIFGYRMKKQSGNNCKDHLDWRFYYSKVTLPNNKMNLQPILRFNCGRLILSLILILLPLSLSGLLYQVDQSSTSPMMHWVRLLVVLDIQLIDSLEGFSYSRICVELSWCTVSAPNWIYWNYDTIWNFSCTCWILPCTWASTRWVQRPPQCERDAWKRQI